MSHNPIIDKTVLSLLPVDLEELRVLDCGFGRGFWGFCFKTQFKSVPHITGLEIYRPYVERQEGLGLYDELVEANVLDMPFPDNHFDIVLACEIIEHLERDDGFRMLLEIERVCRNLLIVTTPWGFLGQDEYDGNKYQVHLSFWHPFDFKVRGFKVKIVDMRNMSRFIMRLDTLRRRMFNIPIRKEIVAWREKGANEF